MERYAIILGVNFRLALAELDVLLRTKTFAGKIIDYSTTCAIVEFETPNIDLSLIGDLMIRLGLAQKMVKIIEFVDRSVLLDGFPENVTDRKTEMFNGRDKMKTTLRNVVYEIFDNPKGKNLFVANSIYPIEFRSAYYPVLLNYFLIFANKFITSYLKERGAKKAIYYQYPEDLIKKGTLHPLFPHHFFAYKLYEPNRKEIVYCQTEEGMYIGITQTVSDSNYQKALDEMRPYVNFKRSISPKLAKAMLNFLALEEPLSGKKILDPFCGSGTILMFAKLFGFDVHGSDIGDEEVYGTIENLLFFHDTIQKPVKRSALETKIVKADVKDLKNHFPSDYFDGIVSEPILLPFFKEVPGYEDVMRMMEKDVLKNYKNFIQIAHTLLKKGGRVIISSPVVVCFDGPKIFLPIVKHAKNAGFKQIPIMNFNRIIQKSSKALTLGDFKTKSILDTGSKYVYREFIILEKL